MINSFNTFWNGLTNQQQTMVIWILVLSAIAFTVYILYLIITGIFEYHKPTHTIKVSIDSNRRENVDASEIFSKLFTMFHTPFQSDILTLEVHKVPTFEGVMFTTRNPNKVQLITGILKSIEGVTIQESQEDQDPMYYYTSKGVTPKSTLFKSSKRYDNFNQNSTKFVHTVQKIIHDLPQEEYASVVLTMRPVNLKQKLDIKIGELRYKVYDNKNKTPNQHNQHQIEKLTEKNKHLMYIVKPQIVGSSKETIQKLEGSFNLIINENTLYPTNTKYNPKNHRFILSQSIFSTPMYWLGLSKSTYMNTKELGCWLYF